MKMLDGSPGKSVLEQLRRSFAICKKDIRIYYAKGPVLIFGVLMPLFLFAAFLIGRDVDPRFLVSSLMSMTIFFSATAVVPAIMPWESQARTLERLVSSPVSVTALILGDILASFLFGAFLSLVPILIGLAMRIVVVSPILLFGGVMLASFCYSSLAAILSTRPTDIPSNVMMISTFVKFPLLFISGVFIPIENLPRWGKIAASLSPLTYFTDLSRHSIEGRSYFPLLLDFLSLTAFTIFFFAAAVKLHEKNMPKRL
jgi:ABC-2 type transport system permease protein